MNKEPKGHVHSCTPPSATFTSRNPIRNPKPSPLDWPQLLHSFPLRHSSAARGVSTQTEASSIALQVRPRPGGFLLPLDPGRPRPGPRPPPWAVTRGHHPTAAVQPVGRRQQLTLAFGVVLSPPSTQRGEDLTPDLGEEGGNQGQESWVVPGLEPSQPDMGE